MEVVTVIAEDLQPNHSPAVSQKYNHSNCQYQQSGIGWFVGFPHESDWHAPVVLNKIVS